MTSFLIPFFFALSCEFIWIDLVFDVSMRYKMLGKWSSFKPNVKIHFIQGKIKTPQLLSSFHILKGKGFFFLVCVCVLRPKRRVTRIIEVLLIKIRLNT